MSTAGDDDAPADEYETIFHATDDAVFLVDVTGTDGDYTFTFRRSNESHQQQTGFTEAELRGRTPRELLGEDMGSQIAENYRRCAEQQAVIEYDETLDLPAGTAHWHTKLTPVVESGTVAGIVGTGRNVTERRERERALRNVTERLELAIDGASLGVWDWDMTTDEVEFNDNWATMLGYDPDEIRPHLDEWERRVHPDDMAAVQTALDEHVAGESEYYETEHRMRTADGDWNWIRDVGKIFERDADGTAVRAVGIHVDIDEQKRASRTLREEREMFAQGPAVVFQWSPESGWPVEYVSDNVQEVLGYAPGEFDDGNRPFADLVHEADLERVARTIDDNSGPGTDRFNHDPYRVVTADGDVRWVLDHTRTVRTDGEITRRRGYLLDITERKRREQELEYYETLVKTFSDVVTVIDTDGVITYVSPSVRNLLGYDPEELVGENGFEHQPPETAEAVETAIEAVVANPDESRTVQTKFRCADGSWTWIEATIQNRLDDDVIDGLLVSSRDISERYAYEQRIREQRDNLDVLNQVLRHDIRNDLQLVTAYAEMLTEADDLEYREYAETVLESAEHAVDLTTTAGEMADIMLSEHESDDLVAMESTLRMVIDSVQAAYPEAAIRVTGQLPPVRVRANEMLDSVFRNLLKNAVQHNDEDVAVVTVAAAVRDDVVSVRIADNGPGVPDTQKDTIFGKGQKGLDSQGTGLGLYLVNVLVEGYGGDLWVEDRESGGAVFVVELPVADAER